jgi:hypothetical protein
VVPRRRFAAARRSRRGARACGRRPDREARARRPPLTEPDAVTLAQVHAATLIIALLATALVAIKARATGRVLRDFLLERTSAANLGALRILIFWKLYESTDVGVLVRYATLPAALRRLPYGWAWLRDVVPFDPVIVARAELVFIGASALALAGVFTRVSAPVAALLSVYMLGLPNFFLKIDHGNHAIVLCALILAVSPCGDALSIDRLWMRWRGYASPALATCYTVPVRLSWLILGTVYLFPGFWKLWESGDLWISGIKLKVELYRKWSQLQDFEPLWRIDESPVLLSLLGIATLLFEIGFIFALLHRHTRVVAALGAIGFHWGTRVMMKISFHPTLPLMLLFDAPGLPRLLAAHAPRLAGAVERARSAIAGRASALLQRIGAREPLRPFPGRTAVFAFAVGTVLFAAQMVAGAASIDSWPIAVHPRFSDRETKPPTGAKSVVVLHQPRGGTARDVGGELRLGSAKRVRLAQKLRKVSKSKAKLQVEGRMVVELFRGSGVAIAAGDRISIVQEHWSLFPLGQRTNLKRKSLGEYLVTDEGSLERAK